MECKMHWVLVPVTIMDWNQSVYRSRGKKSSGNPINYLENGNKLDTINITNQQLRQIIVSPNCKCTPTKSQFLSFINPYLFPDVNVTCRRVEVLVWPPGQAKDKKLILGPGQDGGAGNLSCRRLHQGPGGSIIIPDLSFLLINLTFRQRSQLVIIPYQATMIPKSIFSKLWTRVLHSIASRPRPMADEPASRRLYLALIEHYLWFHLFSRFTFPLMESLPSSTYLFIHFSTQSATLKLNSLGRSTSTCVRKSFCKGRPRDTEALISSRFRTPDEPAHQHTASEFGASLSYKALFLYTHMP